ncbi:hypothetical protein F0U44_04250 [Nocardioides humilatus]|uniref:chitinase n=1 Tax=Nocardioides humilatus TaxID=2607660 RepID=A0A5B1LPD1_9ACTN|nr:glycosyl hydrolase family 18 protein [Nocardioides humilatus]KAA1421509.1 hypothetical protein F0U44_04250 [Nocardioides humilatus]
MKPTLALAGSVAVSLLVSGLSAATSADAAPSAPLASPPAAGDVVVAAFDGTVTAISTASGATHQVAGAGGLTDGGFAIAREASGALVVASRVEAGSVGRVTRVSPNGAKAQIAQGPAGYFVLSAAVSPTTSEIVVGDESIGACPGSDPVGIATGVIWVYSADGSEVRCQDNALSEAEGGLIQNNGAQGMVFDDAGHLFVASSYGGDDTRGAIIEVDVATGRQLEIVSDNATSDGAGGASLFYDLRGLTRAPSGMLYVVDDRNINGHASCNPCNGDDTRIVGVDPATGRQTLVSDNDRSAAAGGQRLLTRPFAVTVAANGRLYVADDDGQVIEINPSTGAQTLLASGLGSIHAIVGVPGGACAPVHESSATVQSRTQSASITESSTNVVKRTSAGVTVRARVGVETSVQSEAEGVATVDNCPGGVSAPYTATESRTRDGAATGTASRKATRATLKAAKKAAKSSAKKAAVKATAPSAQQEADTAAIAAAAAAALAAAEAGAEGGSAARWSIGYYAGYESTDYPPSAVDWSGLTDVAMAFYLPTGTGALDGTLFQGSPAQGADLASRLINAAHAHGKRALASIGGADTRASFRSSMLDHRAAFVQSIVALRDQGYDGIDIDWEPAEAEDLPLIAQLGRKIHQAWPGAVLTSTHYSVNTNFIPDLSGMAEVAGVYDFISVQTYGMAGAYSGWQSWHSSALMGSTSSTPTSVETSVEAYLDGGVPAAKLGVGIGAFGLCYSGPVSAPSQSLGGSTIIKSDYDLQFRAVRTVYQPAMTRHYDSTAKAPYLSGSKNGCSYISYEDEQSVAAKLAYLEAEGLAGVVMWTINQQFVPSATPKNPLLDTIATAWLS